MARQVPHWSLVVNVKVYVLGRKSRVSVRCCERLILNCILPFLVFLLHVAIEELSIVELLLLHFKCSEFVTLSVSRVTVDLSGEYANIPR